VEGQDENAKTDICYIHFNAAKRGICFLANQPPKADNTAQNYGALEKGALQPKNKRIARKKSKYCLQLGDPL